MTVKFTSHVELEEVEGYENAVFEIASPKGVQINSKDEEFKSYMLDQVQLPDGWASERNDYKLAVYPEASSRYYYIQPEKPKDFSDLSIWRTGEPENLLQAESFPGYADYIHPKIEGQNTHFSFHLNGVAYKIRGMNYEYAHDYPAIKFDLYDNGSFEFVESFVNRRIDAAITEGSRLIIGRDCTAEYQWQGAINYSRIKNGGRFDALGVLNVGSWQVINDAGGVVNFDPVSFTLTGHGWHTVSSGFENSGNMNFPNGLVINSTCTYLNQWGPWIFRQKSGVMRFGGPLVKNNTDGHPYCFDLSGGTLAVDADLAMEFFDYVGMSNENTTASIDVAEGKTLTWTNAAFVAGTCLYKKGAGTLRLGADVPELVVSNGILRVEGVATVEKLSLSSGATFVFAAEGAVNLGDVEMEEGSMFSIDESLMRRRYVRVLAKSSDAETLEAVCARMVVPESYAVQVAGDELRIVNKLGLKVIVR
jgi:hypothetical protein